MEAVDVGQDARYVRSLRSRMRAMVGPVPGHAAFAEPVASGDSAYRAAQGEFPVNGATQAALTHRAMAWHDFVLLGKVTMYFIHP